MRIVCKLGCAISGDSSGLTFHMMLRFDEGPPGTALPTVPFNTGKLMQLYFAPHRIINIVKPV